MTGLEDHIWTVLYAGAAIQSWTQKLDNHCQIRVIRSFWIVGLVCCRGLFQLLLHFNLESIADGSHLSKASKLNRRYRQQLFLYDFDGNLCSDALNANVPIWMIGGSSVVSLLAVSPKEEYRRAWELALTHDRFYTLSVSIANR